jgi:hypothetical protein
MRFNGVVKTQDPQVVFTNVMEEERQKEDTAAEVNDHIVVREGWLDQVLKNFSLGHDRRPLPNATEPGQTSKAATGVNPVMGR